MASIDWGTLALGAVVGVGCRKQLRAASRIAANTAASLSAAAASAVAQVAAETQKTEKSPEAAAANAKVEEINRKIDQLWNDLH